MLDPLIKLNDLCVLIINDDSISEKFNLKRSEYIFSAEI